MNMLIWMRVESLVTHQDLEPLQGNSTAWCYNLKMLYLVQFAKLMLYLVYKLNCIAHNLISLYTCCYIKNKNIKIVTRCRDSRSAKSIETR